MSTVPDYLMTAATDMPGAGPTAGSLEQFLADAEHRAYRMARYALWDHEQALDVVQDSMLKLVERYRERPPAEWPALFFTIVAHRINDLRRWRRVRSGAGRLLSLVGLGRSDDGEQETDLLDTHVVDDPPGDRIDPEQALARRQQRAAIEAALAGLPDRQRDTFILREWQGLDIKETARALGCSEGSVKQHHFRALKALRQTLAEVWDHAPDIDR